MMWCSYLQTQVHIPDSLTFSDNLIWHIRAEIKWRDSFNGTKHLEMNISICLLAYWSPKTQFHLTPTLGFQCTDLQQMRCLRWRRLTYRNWSRCCLRHNELRNILEHPGFTFGLLNVAQARKHTASLNDSEMNGCLNLWLSDTKWYSANILTS